MIGEMTLFMASVNGKILDRSGTVELTLRLSKEELEAFTRLREVMSASGKNPKNSEVLFQAVQDALEKRDPLRKAQRAEERLRKQVGKEAMMVIDCDGSGGSNGNGSASNHGDELVTGPHALRADVDLDPSVVVSVQQGRVKKRSSTPA